MFFQGAAQVATQGPDLAKAALDHYGELIAAIGALGTAAYGVVDATKGFYGGVSNVGFPAIAALIRFLFPDSSQSPSNLANSVSRSMAATFAPTTPFHDQSADGLSTNAILRTLKSNWINGMPSTDQRAIAKSLVKLRLDSGDVPHFAQIARVDEEKLNAVVSKMKAGATLTIEEQNTYGRFDLVLTALLDQAYQRGDQRYRNTAKLLAIPVSVALAVWGGVLYLGNANFHWSDFANFFILGLLATPLAPVAKDLTSALTAAVKLAQTAKGRK